MNEERNTEIEKAIIDAVNTTAFNNVIEEVATHSGFRKGVNWADSHPSQKLIERILDLAFDWDGIGWNELVNSVKEKLWNENN